MTPRLLGLLLFCAAAAAQSSKSGYLDVGGSKIYYEECGAGPSIVLVHDGLVHSVTWDGEWNTLCQKYHVIRYDRRGYGRSEAPRAGFLQTDDLSKLMAHLKTPRATVVGCSSGSALSIDFAIRHPDKVERMVLIGPVVHGMPSSEHFMERGRNNSAPLGNGDVQKTAANWSRDPYLTMDGHTAARKALYDALVKNPQNLRYTGEFEIRFLKPAVTRLNEIHVPTLILVGDHDIPDVHAHAGVIQAGIWGSEREVIPDCGHLISLEKPEWLSARIARFIETRKPVEVPVQTLEKYTGKYKVYGQTGEVFLQDGRLMLRIPAEKEIPLFAESDSRFYFHVWGEVKVQFLQDQSGKITGVDLIEDGKTQHCERVG